LQHWRRLPAGQGHKDRVCNAALRTPGPGPTIDTGRSKVKRTRCANARRRAKVVPRDGIEPPTRGFSIRKLLFIFQSVSMETSKGRTGNVSGNLKVGSIRQNRPEGGAALPVAPSIPIEHPQLLIAFCDHSAFQNGST